VPFASARVEPARLFRLALAASLTVSALLFFLCSWRWPLVGDSALIHYIGFLIQRHWAPYRQLGDLLEAEPNVRRRVGLPVLQG